MIELSGTFEGDTKKLEPFVSVVTTSRTSVKNAAILYDKSVEINGNKIQLDLRGQSIKEGEILLFFPASSRFERFYRPDSNSNTILLTEKCDQTCVMCSQPPKNKDYLHWDLYKKAIDFLPNGSLIGITGGEPTLYKKELLDFLIYAIQKNSSLYFHVLTNGQHFNSSDIEKLKQLNKNVVWAVPLYGATSEIHDLIVGKPGAFRRLENNFIYLLSSNSKVELRSCVLKQNYTDLINLSRYISINFQWVQNWAIMQLEPIGFAILDWEKKFVDTSVDQGVLENAVLSSVASGINVNLYNFPICSIPYSLKKFCVMSISDWKNKYLDVCNLCSQKSTCSGFFEWYTKDVGYQNLRGPFK